MIKINKYFIPYVIIFILLGFKGDLIIAFLIVVAHEFVHYLGARYLGFSGFNIEVFPFGTALKIKDLDEASLKEDLIIALVGPMANLILAASFYFLYRYSRGSYWCLLYEGNLIIGIFNLIPAFPLDGGRILRDILARKMLYKKANRYMVNISILIGIIFMVSYITLFFSNKNNFNIGLISVLIIVCSLKEKERISYIIMGDIIKKRYKFLKKGYIENNILSIHYKSDLIDVLAIIDKNKYSIFTVLDDDMNVIDIVYEEEILQGLKNYGNIKVNELINIENKL